VVPIYKKVIKLTAVITQGCDCNCLYVNILNETVSHDLIYFT